MSLCARVAGRACWAVLGLGLARAGTAHADAAAAPPPAAASSPAPVTKPEAEPVRLIVPDCYGVSGTEVTHLAALELAPRVRVVGQGTAASLEGRLSCAASRVTLEVDDASRPNARTLRVELDLETAAPRARPRLLALSLAELVATSRLERAAQRDAAAAHAAATDAPAAAARAHEPAAADDSQASAASRDTAPEALRLWLAPSASRALSPAALWLGLELGAERALGPLSLLVDVQARYGGITRAGAELSATGVSLGAALGPRVSFSPWQLVLGAGMRAGYVALSATPTADALSGDTHAGLWLGPLALAALQLQLAPPLALRLGLEGGYVLRPVVGLDAQASELFALRGAWLSAGLGVSLGLR